MKSKINSKFTGILTIVWSLLGTILPLQVFASLPGNPNVNQAPTRADTLIKQNWSSAKTCITEQNYKFQTESELEEYLLKCIGEKIRDEKIKTAIIFDQK